MAPKKSKKRDDDLPDEPEDEKVVKSKGKKGKNQVEEKVVPVKKSKKGESLLKIDVILIYL